MSIIISYCRRLWPDVHTFWDQWPRLSQRDRGSWKPWGRSCYMPYWYHAYPYSLPHLAFLLTHPFYGDVLIKKAFYTTCRSFTAWYVLAQLSLPLAVIGSKLLAITPKTWIENISFSAYSQIFCMFFFQGFLFSLKEKFVP